MPRTALAAAAARSWAAAGAGRRAIRPYGNARRPLRRPSVVWSSNHLLAVNKPAGWRSVPNKRGTGGDGDDGKCLLERLRSEGCGGGSRRDFLLPVHRLDQPCTGLQLYAKTRRAASRIQSRWRTGGVRKTYLVVLGADLVEEEEAAAPSVRARFLRSRQEREPGGSPWSTLEGYMDRRRRRHHQRHHQHQQPKSKTGDSGGGGDRGWSVTMLPSVPVDGGTGNQPPGPHGRYRKCSLRYAVLDPSRRLVLVDANDGARHVIRALFAMAGACVAGDLRYGARRALPDGSVALHARRLQLSSEHIPLGDDAPPPSLVAPLPELWREHFGLTEQHVLRLELPLLSASSTPGAAT